VFNRRHCEQYSKMEARASTRRLVDGKLKLEYFGMKKEVQEGC
jgi:hypothetical protein